MCNCPRFSTRLVELSCCASTCCPLLCRHSWPRLGLLVVPSKQRLPVLSLLRTQLAAHTGWPSWSILCVLRPFCKPASKPQERHPAVSQLYHLLASPLPLPTSALQIWFSDDFWYATCGCDPRHAGASALEKLTEH